MYKKLLFQCIGLLLFTSCGHRVLQPVALSPELIPISARAEPDSAVNAYIEPYREQLQEKMKEVLGRSTGLLEKGPVESSLANFIVDVLQEKGEKYAGIPIDMGVITIGGIRAPLPAGEIKLRDIYELMPFENLVYILRLKGTTVKKLFDYLAINKTLAVSNSSVVVADGIAVEIMIGGQPLDEKKDYHIAISDYLANGGDYLFFLSEGEVVAQLELKQRDVIIEKIRDLEARQEKVVAQIEGRVILKD